MVPPLGPRELDHGPSAKKWMPPTFCIVEFKERMMMYMTNDRKKIADRSVDHVIKLPLSSIYSQRMHKASFVLSCCTQVSQVQPTQQNHHNRNS